MTSLLHRPPVVPADLVETSEPAPESLRPWLSELGRIPTLFDLSEPFTHIPQTSTTIVLRDEQRGPRAALVVGPQTKAIYSRASTPAGCVRLRLAPGAIRSLLGVPAALLTDRVVRLEDLPGPAADLATVLIAVAPDEVLPYLEGVLPHRITDDAVQRAERSLLGSAVAAITTDPALPVPALAARLSVSERQLRNLFTNGIGVSPKHFARIDRVRRVLSHAGDSSSADSTGTADYYKRSTVRIPRISLAQLATDNGYYDQSHLSADFRTLMGVPPSRFFRGQLPTPTPCRPLHSGF
ncbi:helix-turn-helix domain-containing protein [Nocardia sp. NPDC049220]|uniref:AraC family transcriptional regulator n=1 Tax=Nocardia sp. NPDC049220 TaxID=3155273 RepID=UPI0033E3EE47